MYNNTGDEYAFIGTNYPISSANIDDTGLMLSERSKFTGRTGMAIISTATLTLMGREQ